MLYKKPFHNNKDHIHNYLLINTFLGCLNEEEKFNLVTNDIEIKSELPKLFEYGKYVQEFPYSKLEFATHVWFYYNYYENDNQKYISEKNYFFLNNINDKRM